MSTDGPANRREYVQAMRQSAIRLLLTLATVFTLTATPAHSQRIERIEIIIDGERVEVDFQDWDRAVAQQNALRVVQPSRLPNVDIILPSDEELSRIVIDPSLLALVAELDSDSFAAREKATAELIAARYDDDQLYAILSRHPLSVEQRSRLVVVATERLADRPRGAIGISMGERHMPGQDGFVHVEVSSLIPGLPAEHLLKTQDLITHFNGQRLRSREQLTMSVQSRRPGDTITLTVLRPRRDAQPGQVFNGRVPHEELEVEITLGSVDKLSNPAVPGMRPTTTIEQTRRLEARAIARRFAPKPQVVSIDDDFFAAAFSDEVHPHVRPYIERQIEGHPIIEELREQLRLLELAGLGVPEILRDEWREREALLRRHIGRDDVAPQQRAILEGVLKRFMDLRPE
jgi:hypothetical protein